MLLLKNIKDVLTLQGVKKKDGRRILKEDLSLLHKISIVCDSKIRYIGPLNKLPSHYFKKIQNEINLNNHCVLPGLIESHTHTIFAGSRASEFEKRMQGVSYQQIAAEGGGILSTVRATREASKKELLKLGQVRVNQFVKQGVSCLEIKSGYGLELDTELKMLQVAVALKGPQIVTTFLGAHAKPPEFNSAKDFLNHLEKNVLPVVKRKKLSSRVDIFIESGFFEKLESKSFLNAAKKMGFSIVIHADQLSLSGGSELALELNAASADHVIQLSPKLIKKLAQSSVVCTLLPIADLYMKCNYPPARKLIDAGAKVALATDFNPGTSPSQDLALVGVLSRLEMKMSLPEVIAAYTYNAASALNMQDSKGVLEVNFDADFSCYENEWDQIFYSSGGMSAFKTISRGKIIT